MAGGKNRIVVAGDVCIDWFAIPVSRKAPSGASSSTDANWQLRDGIRMFPHAGGAWLLAELLNKATGHNIIHQPIPPRLEHEACESALHSILEINRFPLSYARKEKEK